MHTYLYVLFSISRCLKGPWSFVAHKVTISGITLSHEFQLLCPQAERGLHTRLYSSDIVGLSGAIYYPGHRRKHFLQESALSYFCVIYF